MARDLPRRQERTAPGSPHGGRTGPADGTSQQVARFRKARQARRGELADDYVELIAELIDEGGEARQVDIAARLGVAQPTVAKMLRKLVADGLVQQRPYRGAFLTDVGRERAEESRRRHQVVESVLIALGVEPETAGIDAEGIEHHVSEATLRAFERFLAQGASKASRS